MNTDDRPASPEQVSLSLATEDDASLSGSINQEDLTPSPGDSDEQSIDSGCPGGSASGGICTPYNNLHRSSWMSTYDGVRKLRIADAILPGTHNAGFDKEAPYSPNSNTCQDVSPYKQLMTGVRVLDLRVQFFDGYPAEDPKRFMIFHDLVSQRTVANDFLGEILRFRTHTPGAGAPKREIIVLDFHQFKNFTAAAHLELHQLIKSRLNDILIPPWMNALTISQIWEYENPAVVIAYNDGQRDSLFWPGVNHRWIGSNTPTTDTLKAFMDRVAQEDKPYEELRSIQCAKYVAFPAFVPDDFSDKIRQWFYSTNQLSYIQKFFVINTDWSLRQRLIDNCIHANVQKLIRMGPYADINVPQVPDGYILPSGNRALIARLGNGSWTRIISPPAYLTTNSTVLIISSATYSTELVTNRIDFPFDSMLLNTGDMLSLSAINGTLRYRILAATYLADEPEIPAPGLHDKLIHYQLADGHWSPQIKLAPLAPDSSIVHIASSASLAATLDGSNLDYGLDIPIPTGFSEYFIFHEYSGKWERIGDEPIPPPELTAPTGFRIAHNTYQPIDLSWNRVAAAVKYKVYRWWTQIDETTDLSFVRNIEGYGRYHVRAVDAAGNLSQRTDYLYFFPPS
ncbi:MAG: hypothetical protein ABW209_13375 [Pseudomonas caspiana]